MGTKNINNNMVVDQKRIIEELETIMDPEIGLDLWTLGLIYNVTVVTDKHIQIVMTYTTPLCPFGGQLKAAVTSAMHDLGFTEVDLEVTFDPPWTPSENLRDMLGI